MSQKDGKDYLYLIWKAEKSRKQYIVGELIRNGQFEFRYVEKVAEAINDGFTPLLCFQNLQQVYKDEKLFPVFSSRLPDRKRKDIQNILKKYDLEEYDEYMLLKRSGARLPIDNFEFIDPIFDINEKVKRIFFMAGPRHYLGCNGNDCKRSVMVTVGDEIVLQREPKNRYDAFAVKMLDVYGHMLGYIPRYYSEGVSMMLDNQKQLSCQVYSVDKSKNCNECIKVELKSI